MTLEEQIKGIQFRLSLAKDHARGYEFHLSKAPYSQVKHLSYSKKETDKTITLLEAVLKTLKKSKGEQANDNRRAD